jgi:hypothetical protein
MNLDRIFNEERNQDPMGHLGRVLGNIVGGGIMLMMLWVVTRNFMFW